MFYGRILFLELPFGLEQGGIDVSLTSGSKTINLRVKCAPQSAHGLHGHHNKRTHVEGHDA